MEHIDFERLVLRRHEDPKPLSKCIETTDPKVFDQIGALRFAAVRDDFELVKQLVEAGCSVDALDKNGCAAIESAVHSGNVEMTAYLLSHGADVNNPRHRLLFSAATNGKGIGLTLTKMLVQHGVDINATFDAWDSQKSPLDWAAGVPEIFEYLRSVGAKSATEILGSEQPQVSVELDDVARFMTKTYGQVDHDVIHEIVSGEPPITVRMIHPNQESECITLFTSGMSASTLKTPAGDAICAELFLQLPAKWPITDLTTKENAWPVIWLQNIARYPHQNNAELAPHFIVHNDHQPLPGTTFKAILVLAEHLVTREDHENISVYRLMPLYAEEVKLFETSGIQALLSRFDSQKVSPTIDTTRNNVAAAQ